MAVFIYMRLVVYKDNKWEQFIKPILKYNALIKSTSQITKRFYKPFSAVTRTQTQYFSA